MKRPAIRWLFATVSACAAVTATGTPAHAHADSPASPPLVPTELKLQHADATRIVALFSLPQLPRDIGGVPRAARVDEVGSLVPYGADAVLQTRDPQELTLVGTEAVSTLRDCIGVLDVPLQTLSPQRERLVIRGELGLPLGK
jgi:hypothetical protein